MRDALLDPRLPSCLPLPASRRCRRPGIESLTLLSGERRPDSSRPFHALWFPLPLFLSLYPACTMVEITSKLILHRLNVTWANLVERLAQFFYTDESYEMLDVLNVMLLAWALLGLAVYVVGTFLANRLVRAQPPPRRVKGTEDIDGQRDNVEETVTSQRSPGELGTARARHKEEVSFPVSAKGSDPDAVLWTNRVLAWILGLKQHEFLTEPWIRALNEKLAKSPTKVSTPNFRKMFSWAHRCIFCSQPSVSVP